jgi:tRNA pseudouridine55 synthase
MGTAATGIFGGVTREISGVLNINKPAGMTSHDVVDAVRKILAVRRVGHTGTLDPQATGVLPLCVGRATRIAQYLTQADKEYVMTLRLGITTDTLDAAGRVTSRVEDIRVQREDVEAVLPRFMGDIQQVPPLFSAKKHHGERFYRLARRGQPVERHPVMVRIHSLELLEFSPPFVRLRAICSKGTYARSLCDDLGQALGCGGHLHSLMRTRSGRFSLDGVLTLSELEERVRQGRLAEVLMPVSEALAHLPAVRVVPEAGRVILHGGSVPASLVAQFPEGVTPGTLARVLGYRKQLLCLAESCVASGDFSTAESARVVLRPVRVFSGLA